MRKAKTTERPCGLCAQGVALMMIDNDGTSCKVSKEPGALRHIADDWWAPCTSSPEVLGLHLYCPKCLAPHVDKSECPGHQIHCCDFCEHEWRPFHFLNVGVPHPPTPGMGRRECFIAVPVRDPQWGDSDKRGTFLQAWDNMEGAKKDETFWNSKGEPHQVRRFQEVPPLAAQSNGGTHAPIADSPVPSDAEIGDYVFASRWSDGTPQDPWWVGVIEEKLIDGLRPYFKLKGCPRQWPHVRKITPDEGKKILETFPGMEMADIPAKPMNEADLARRVLETYCEVFQLRKGMPLWDLAVAVCGNLEAQPIMQRLVGDKVIPDPTLMQRKAGEADLLETIREAFREGASVYELGPIDGEPMSDDQLEKCWNLSNAKTAALAAQPPAKVVEPAREALAPDVLREKLARHLFSRYGKIAMDSFWLGEADKILSLLHQSIDADKMVSPPGIPETSAEGAAQARANRKADLKIAALRGYRRGRMNQEPESDAIAEEIMEKLPAPSNPEPHPKAEGQP